MEQYPEVRVVGRAFGGWWIWECYLKLEFQTLMHLKSMSMRKKSSLLERDAAGPRLLSFCRGAYANRPACCGFAGHSEVPRTSSILLLLRFEHPTGQEQAIGSCEARVDEDKIP